MDNPPLSEIQLRQAGRYRYEIPVEYDSRMNVPGIVFTSENIMRTLKGDQSLTQVANVAMLPGIVQASYAMPDIHWGYGFPIGGVAAFDWQEGVVSPGGVGYDINCGVTLVKTDIKFQDIRPKIRQITDDIFRKVPSGIGSTSEKLSESQMDDILENGLKWAIENGHALPEDADHTEEGGSMPNAEPREVSREARARGVKQLGTLGAGNHFLEIQRVDRIFDSSVAAEFGVMEPDQVTVMIHTGSRGLGHQVASDFIRDTNRLTSDVYVHPVDRQLNSARMGSTLADRYLGAMSAAANFGFVNRQMIVSRVREVFKKWFPESSLGIVYGLAHNIAKVEKHVVDGENRRLIVHRKGATRAFAGGNPNLGGVFRYTGHPVLVPGDMGTASYLLVGVQGNDQLSFGSSCHGAGRLISRTKSLNSFNSETVTRNLENMGIYLRAQSKQVISEEAPGSYKNIDDVIEAVTGAMLTRPVARMVPVGVVKG